MCLGRFRILTPVLRDMCLACPRAPGRPGADGCASSGKSTTEPMKPTFLHASFHSPMLRVATSGVAGFLHFRIHGLDGSVFVPCPKIQVDFQPRWSLDISVLKMRQCSVHFGQLQGNLSVVGTQPSLNAGQALQHLDNGRCSHVAPMFGEGPEPEHKLSLELGQRQTRHAERIRQQCDL